MEQNGETVVEDVQSQATTEGVSVAAEITHGVPHQVISEYCDQQDIDLVVMETHGRSGISRRLVGSVTERVLRSSDMPVLTICGV
nr:universal stress protein [Halogranum salarium]